MRVVAPNLCPCVCLHVCLLAATCLPACLLPLCSCSKHAQSEHTHTHTVRKASPHHSSPTRCCWPAVCSVLSDYWVQERGLVVWPWPDKAAAPLLFFYLSVAHTPQSICPSIHQSDPQAAQHKHLLLPFMPEVPSTGWWVCLSLPPSLASLSWAPSTGHCLAPCICVPVICWPTFFFS